MSGTDIVSRLDGVRETGPDRWIARCPAHEDRSPSLSVRETADGTILLHCFAGCGALEIVHAVGLELRDLFPRNDHPQRKPHRPQWNYRELLGIVELEVNIVQIAANTIARNEALTSDDLARVNQAALRLRQVLGVVRG